MRSSRTAKPLLDKLTGPQDLNGMSMAQLQQLAQEVRAELIEVIPTISCGGHFGANLGTVELSVALHHLFDSPRDKLIWDVGHQAYPHKLLTGRAPRLATIRQEGGLAPFCKPAESDHDIVGAGHGGTSISAALGLAEARDLAGEDHAVVAIIGDGSLTAGMSFEAMNHAGALKSPLIVVINDNGMGISPNVGALHNYLTQIKVNQRFSHLKERIEGLLHHLPLGDELVEGMERLETAARGLTLPQVYFECLGFDYLGPIDGHDLEVTLRTLRYAHHLKRPVVVHLLTEKGKGHAPAEEDPGRMHAVKPSAKGPKVRAFTDVFVDTFAELAERDPRVCGITAAMLEGTGLVKVQERFASRIFDVGMAEQHAVTFATGLALGGRRPIAAIYSTFLQRAYDQIVHDVAIHNAPVILCLDRAGCVGNDGPTHQGVFDLAYLRHIPNLSVLAPKDEAELRAMMHAALAHTDRADGGPVALRYPRDNVFGVSLEGAPDPIPWGRGETLRQGDGGTAVLACGTPATTALCAAEHLATEDLSLTVINARFVKPLDHALIVDVARNHQRLITVEDHAIDGGFGSAVLETLATEGLGVPVHRLGVPDAFVEHGNRADQLRWYRLDEAGLIEACRAVARGEDTAALKLVG